MLFRSTDMPTVANDTLVRQTVRKMLNREFKYLPVVDYDNKLLGIVNRTTMVDVVYDTIWGNSDDNIAEKEEDQAKYQETATVKGE